MKHKSKFLLFILVLLASMGQMTGKCVLYWSGRGAIPIKKGEKGRIAKALNSWKERLERSSKKTWGLVLISAISGIPPLYIMSILAGTFRLRFSLFIAVVMCGRLLHFGVIALIPQIGSNYFSLS